MSSLLTTTGRVLLLLADGRERRIVEVSSELTISLYAARRALDNLRAANVVRHRRRGSVTVWGTVAVYDSVKLVELLLGDALRQSDVRIDWGYPDRRIDETL